MAINMPTPSLVGETYLAPNGVNYIWDGVKWTVAEDAASGVNLWARNPVSEEIQPIYPGDSVVIANDSGTETARITDDGEVQALSYDIDSLTDINTL